MPRSRSSSRRTAVRSHSRKLASGRTVTVRRHRRKVTFAHTAMGLLNYQNRPRANRRVMSPGRAFWTLRHAGRAVRRRRHGRAIGLGLLGLTELVGWLAFRTVGFYVTTIVVVLSAVGMFVLSRTAPDAPKPPRGPNTAKRTTGGAHRQNKAIK